jgi:hypothetical protein
LKEDSIEASTHVETSEQNGLGTLRSDPGSYAFQCAPPAKAMASRELRAIATRLTSFMQCSSSRTPHHPQVGDMEDYRGSPFRGTSRAIGLRHSTYPPFPPPPAFLRDSGATRCHS